MFPYLINIGGFRIMSFGLAITICFFLFVWMLKKMSKNHNFDFEIFRRDMNLLWYFISILFFSRLFYIIGKWTDYKGITSPVHFFIANDYNFSLMGGIFGFLFVFFILLKLRKEKLDNYIYGLVTAFTFVLPLGFFGAFLGGQIYGIDTNLGIEILYNTKYANIPFVSPVFPLPIVYSILFFILFCLVYISNMYFKEKNILGYAGIMIFSAIIFIFDFFSGKSDIFEDIIRLNLSQISAIFLFLFGAYRIYLIYIKETRRGRIR